MRPRLTELGKDLYHCADCSYCVDAVWEEAGLAHVCATLQSHSPLASYSGRGYIAAARAWHEGAPLDTSTLADRVFTCSTCGHCETVCPIGLRPTQVGLALRAELWAEEAVPAATRALADSVLRDGNPWGVPREARNNWLSAATAPASRGDLLYLPGCAAATGHPAEARAAATLMRAAGHAVHALKGDGCCGAPLHELGRPEDASRLIAALARRAEGAMPIVISGLECAASWARHDTSSEPVQFLDWLLQYLDEGALTLMVREGEGRDVVLHHSCQSRNAAEVNEALRRLCDHLGFRIHEAAGSPRHVVCCGAAGGMPAIAPTSAQRMAEARREGLPDLPLLSADIRCVAHHRQSAPAARVFGPAEFILAHCTVGA
ncbi:MAG: (Fe-S)-binding protein [Gammaproteobacteria bacterium]|nr:(Fe-S)-binding protein [Gammaproteobacteria bacterium]